MEDVPPLCVFAIYPPGEIQHELVENALEEGDVAGVVRVLRTTLFAVHLEHAPGRPGMDGRIHVTEGPLVGGELAIRVHIPFAREQNELALCELGINHRQRDAMEGEIPRGVPRVFPFVGHGDDVRIVEV